ncbi:hypothetical protein H9I32_13910 [Bacillus sp. Xin]|uniref:hypothetical protein n=1 Tax=unclassified Bacillus (in: firmicutes) TaxID=185979 RepID=UPI001574DF9A|nr:MULTISPECIES: hypothetical protein [unclassified Bacillus (in: firmicutes)]MBC6973418.1 hypothetical protein [Bacillus sp. Xin]MCI0765834.1 hypothetical protein [Bacillus sp. TL12]NSW35579.1 hypothetical protein [Bacillus sp. Xin1]
MTINKSNDPKKELALQKNSNMDGLINLKDVSEGIQDIVEPETSTQEGNRASIYWGDEWNVEEGEKRSRKK